MADELKNCEGCEHLEARKAFDEDRAGVLRVRCHECSRNFPDLFRTRPVFRTRWANVYDEHRNVLTLRLSRTAADKADAVSERIAVLRLTWTDGKLTAAKIEEV